MEGKDNIKELFSEKLGNYEAAVNPKIWAKVASQIGTTTTIVSTGVSVLTKWLIGLGVTAAAVTTTILIVNSSEIEKNDPIVEIEEATNNKSTQEEIKTEIKTELTERNIGKTQPNTIPEDVGPTPEEIIEPALIPKPQIVRFTPQVVVSPLATTPKVEIPATVNPEVVTPTPEVKVEEKQSYSIAQYTNIFSPNGDRRNDEFYLEIDGIKDFYLIVINDKSERVFSSDDINFRWNGMDLRGEPVPVGQYVYMLSGRDKDGKPVAHTNSLTIAR